MALETAPLELTEQVPPKRNDFPILAQKRRLAHVNCHNQCTNPIRGRQKPNRTMEVWSLHKQLYLYVNALSDFGSRMNLIAVSALFSVFANSPVWLMAYFLARQAGAVLSSLFAGVLADRFDRRLCMIASDLVCAVAIGSIAIVPHPLTAVIAAFVAGIMYNVFQISFDASIASLFGEGNVKRTNSRIVRLTMIVTVLGFAVSGYVADLWGFRWIVAFDALTFLVSAVMLFRMRWQTTHRRVPNESKGKWRTDLSEAFAYLKAERVYLHLILFAFLIAFGGTAWNYGLPLLSQRDLSHQSTFHGLMWTMMGAGGVVGSFVFAKVRLRAIPAFLTTMVAFSLTISLVFWSSQQVVILGFLFAAGVLDAGVQLYQRTMIQTSDGAYRGRVLGIQALFVRLGYLLGFLAAPALLMDISLPVMIVVVQGVVTGIAMLLARPFSDSARQSLPK